MPVRLALGTHPYGEWSRAPVVPEINVIRPTPQKRRKPSEVYVLQQNWQLAANQFREALNGDLEPKWTEVWSHIFLGQVFDITGQRERAVNEYKQAERTKDNTQGALEEAAKYLKTPYERQKKVEQS